MRFYFGGGGMFMVTNATDAFHCFGLWVHDFAELSPETQNYVEWFFIFSNVFHLCILPVRLVALIFLDHICWSSHILTFSVFCVGVFDILYFDIWERWCHFSTRTHISSWRISVASPHCIVVSLCLFLPFAGMLRFPQFAVVILLCWFVQPCTGISQRGSCCEQRQVENDPSARDYPPLWPAETPRKRLC